jgi:large subunit ribosomal protein L13
MTGTTTSTKAAQIVREWHLRDAKGKTLGRFSTEIATLLMGKSKPYFVRNLDCGDYVVVTNSKEVSVTGKKETDKVYARHSGYPGGFKSETLKELRAKKPENIIRNSVKGMIPRNRVGAMMMKRLFIFADENHKYQDKFK